MSNENIRTYGTLRNRVTVNNGNIRVDGTLRNKGQSEQWEHWNRQNIEERGTVKNRGNIRIEGTLRNMRQSEQ